MRHDPQRRHFLKSAAATAAISATAASAAPKSAGKRIALTKKIPVRTFGKIGMKLPILGYGGAALPKVWGNTLSIAGRVELVQHAYNQGIRYFDTAGNYMESQPIIGAALEGKRENVFLVTKTEATQVPKVRRDVEQALKQLKTSYLDCVEIHGTPGLQQMSVKQAMKIHAELIKIKDEGLIRHIGVSAHGYFDKAYALIATGGFDLFMPAFGYIPRGDSQRFTKKMQAIREKCIAKAHNLNMCLVAMKVIGAGTLGAWSGNIVPEMDKRKIQKLPGAAMRWVLNDKRFHMLLIGMRFKQEIDNNIKVLSGNRTCTREDKALLAAYTKKAMTRKPLSDLTPE